MLLIKELFPRQWRRMAAIYSEWLGDQLRRDIPVRRILPIMEADVVLGRTVYRYGFTRYLEIGCGLALPSITLARLGGRHVLALDVNRAMVAVAEKMAAAAGVSLSVLCRDFDCGEWTAPARDVWLAVKPRGREGRDGLLNRVVKRGIASEISLALVPAYGPEAAPRDYPCRCNRLMQRLTAAGYAVDGGKLTAELPLRWLVAVPGKKDCKGVDKPLLVRRVGQGPTAR